MFKIKITKTLTE